MRLYKVYFILLLFLLSCNTKDKDIPNILTREQMVDILTDIQIIEAKLAYEKKSAIKFEQLSKKYYESVFSKYNISREEFEESLFYYEKDIKELDNIYSDVITNLNKIQSEISDNHNIINGQDSSAIK
ncbi:MAG: DUF4296 domain-containing protein [Bacteroidales bacterium]|nr:DUF4296 domain-containing protein [Bacteroidales bacterium]